MSFRQAIRLNINRKRNRDSDASTFFRSGQGTAVSKQHVKIAKRLMWYPLSKYVTLYIRCLMTSCQIVYAIVIIPVAVCRLGELANWSPPFALMVFAGVCYTCSGISYAINFLRARS